MDDELGCMVQRVEAATRRHREWADAMARCGCVTPCTWCRAMRLVVHGELLTALEQLETTEARLLARGQSELSGA